MILTVYSILTLSVAILSFLIGLFVFINRRNALNMIWFVLCITIAGWNLGYFFTMVPGISYENALLSSRMSHASGILIASFFFTFTLVFLDLIKEKMPQLIFAHIITAILAGLCLTPFIVTSLVPKMFMPLYPVGKIGYVLYITNFLGWVIYSHYLYAAKYKQLSGAKQSQVKYFLLGTVIGFFGGSNCFPLIFNFPFPPIASVLIIVYPFTTAYAIIRHRLMDIEILIKKGIVYSALVAVIIGVYSALLLVIQQLFQSTIGINQWLATVITAICIAAGFKPLENAFTNFTDKYFFKKKYDYHRTLAELAKGMAELTNLERLTKLVARIVVRNMKIEGSMLFVYDYRNNSFNAVSAQGNMKEFKGSTLPKDDPLIKRLDQTEDVLIKEELVRELENKQLISSFREEIRDIIKQMANFKAVLCVPSKIKDKLIGFIMLSDKKSQDMYSTEDLMLFETLAPQAAVAIKNAMTYDEIRKDLEAHQRKLNEAEINLSRSERIASMARLIQEYNHEIRTPLAIMSAKLMSLPDNPGDVADFKAIKDFFGKQINRASDIVDTTLRLSQPKEQKEELLDLNNVIEDALKLYQPLGVNLVKELSPLPRIKGDHDELKLVFINLLKNAKEAIHEKGEIKIGTYTDEENGIKFVVAKVSDNGTGIPKENMEKIFEPFFSTHTTKGRGLGLSLVFRIVREHHGKIEVESPAEGGGKGSTFSVRIPVG
jgi:signal transduction histidine kinase